MKLKKILSFALAAFFAAAPLAKNTAAFPAEIISEAYCVMDAETGQLLVGGSADKRMEPASITKILTCAMALEVLDPKDTYTFTKEAASYDKGSTHLAFTEGEKCRVEDMLYGAMVESANDCAMGLADAVGGSQLGFVKLMNEKAAEIGCTNTHFANATGMPDANHYTTARDMALITRYALSIEGFETYFNAWEWTIPATNKNVERRFGTHHSMIVGSENNASYGYDYATGGKLGWTEEAKHTAVTVADNGKMRLICVVLKSTNKYAKYKDTTALFDYCFDSFRSVEIPISLKKSEVTLYEGEKLYGKMTVHPMAAVKLLLTEDMSADDVSCKVNVPEYCDISEIDSVAVSVSFGKSSSLMATDDVTVRPEYHIVKESGVVEGDASIKKEGSTFRWWIFIVIPVGIIAGLVLLVLCIRAYNIRKYRRLRRHRHYQKLKRE